MSSPHQAPSRPPIFSPNPARPEPETRSIRTPDEALAHWRLEGAIRETPDAGLINQTFLVGDPAHHVLQWVNPIFSPTIHHDIAAITERLAAQGLETPRLVPTEEGQLWLGDVDGCWRVQTFIPGRTLHRLDSVSVAAEAGALVGRFHRALEGWENTFRSPERRIHDTPARMATLESALEAADGHPLATPARDVGARILRAWSSWDGALDLPPRPCHGDLKISNLRFDTAGTRAVCLLDLDTLEAMPLASELGDAWRSWCNPAGEDDPQRTHLDMDLFRAASSAWFANGPDLTDRERQSLVPGVERIALELAARFCADAVHNRYFGEDRRRFPQRGEHNLVRARSQLKLAQSWRDQRSACQQFIDRLPIAQTVTRIS